MRWVQKLPEFDFVIKPVKGKSNKVSDVLLCTSPSNEARNEDYPKVLLRELLDRSFQDSAFSVLQPGQEIISTLRKEYDKYPEIRDHFRNPSPPHSLKMGCCSHTENYELQNGTSKSNCYMTTTWYREVDIAKKQKPGIELNRYTILKHFETT